MLLQIFPPVVSLIKRSHKHILFLRIVILSEAKNLLFR